VQLYHRVLQSSAGIRERNSLILLFVFCRDLMGLGGRCKFTEMVLMLFESVDGLESCECWILLHSILYLAPSSSFSNPRTFSPLSHLLPLPRIHSCRSHLLSRGTYTLAMPSPHSHPHGVRVWCFFRLRGQLPSEGMSTLLLTEREMVLNLLFSRNS
jgi:hypothetical protein